MTLLQDGENEQINRCTYESRFNSWYCCK